MASGLIKKVIQSVSKKVKKLKPKKKFSKKNVGIGRIKQEGLYNTLGKDKYGDIKIINKGPQKGFRVPLDKKKFAQRRPWAGDKSYKASYGERIPAAFPEHHYTKKASGGLVKGFPKIARKGWK